MVNTLTCRMRKICLIHTSVSSKTEARILSTDLMETHLAACIQISGPGVSVYHWKGKLEQTEEFYLNIKTTLACSDMVIKWLKKHHPYELPEIVQRKCEASKAYADWIDTEVSAP